MRTAVWSVFLAETAVTKPWNALSAFWLLPVNQTREGQGLWEGLYALRSPSGRDLNQAHPKRQEKLPWERILLTSLNVWVLDLRWPHLLSEHLLRADLLVARWKRNIFQANFQLIWWSLKNRQNLIGNLPKVCLHSCIREDLDNNIALCL